MQHLVPQTKALFLPSLNPKTALKETRLFLDSGLVSLNKSEKVELSSGELWASDKPRSDGRRAHAWFFARLWPAAKDLLTREEKQDLLTQFELILPLWEKHASNKDSMSFHDETTAQRAMIFVELLHAFQEDMNFNLAKKCSEILQNDVNLLANDEFYAGSNNHGMFQDIALLVATDYGFVDALAAEYEDRAFSRLYDYFLSSFTSEGIHTENNPTYHVMVARYLASVIEYAQLRGRGNHFDKLRKLKEKADTYAAFAVTPFKDFPPISDTNLQTLNTSSAKATFKDGQLVGVLTEGKEGNLPASNVFVAEKSGYGIIRSGWTSPTNSYLFFSAAYNANYHKHSDELSLYYAAKGYELLTESGPNGYQYNDPFTKYAFSSFAHNTLTVDGEGLPRTDGNSHLTTLQDIASSDTKLDVVGRTQRYSGVDWSRQVTADLDNLEENGILISDQVSSSANHIYKFIWHIGREVIPFVRGSFIEFFSKETQEKIAEMEWKGSPSTSVRVFHAQRHPRIQGWQFPVMGQPVPSYSVEVEFEGTNIDIDWQVRTDHFILTDRGITPFNEDWKTFYGEKPVHYLLDLPSDPDEIDQLAVVFSAVNQIGDFTFNYKASLKDYKGAVLYVLDDFGDQGAYYLANGRHMAEFRSTQGLLKSIVLDLGIPLKDVFTIGSSKGGASALLHGVSLGVGNVYSGAPQYKIGDFLKNPHPNILEYMSGGTSEEDIYWTNKITFDILSSGVKSTRLHVIVGLKDAHYRRHVVPLVDDARSLGYSTSLLTVPGSPHSEFGSTFREFIQSLTKEKSSGDAFHLPHVVGLDKDTKQFGVSVVLPPGATALGQLYHNRERLGKIQAFTGNSAVWNINKSGTYRARVYVTFPGETERKAFGTHVESIKF